MSQSIDERAAALAVRINREIRFRCAKQSHLSWNTIMEEVAEHYLADEWEWLPMETFSEPPQIVITQYKGKQHD
jgi:hypothetical protein